MKQKTHFFCRHEMNLVPNTLSTWYVQQQQPHIFWYIVSLLVICCYMLFFFHAFFFAAFLRCGFHSCLFLRFIYALTPTLSLARALAENNFVTKKPHILCVRVSITCYIWMSVSFFLSFFPLAYSLLYIIIIIYRFVI